MERFNGELRDREKVMRGLKKKDTTILTGYHIFHNYIRSHEGLKGDRRRSLRNNRSRKEQAEDVNPERKFICLKAF